MSGIFSHEQQQQLSQDAVEVASEWLLSSGIWSYQAAGATHHIYNEWIIHATAGPRGPLLHLWMNLSTKEVEISSSVLVHNKATHTNSYVPPSDVCDWCKYGSGYPYPTSSRGSNSESVTWSPSKPKGRFSEMVFKEKCREAVLKFLEEEESKDTRRRWR